MSELAENLSSRWIGAAKWFGHTPYRPIVMLYVEGDEDVPFWSEAVAQYQSKYEIRVVTNKAVHPDEGNGKALLLTMSNLGSNKMVAVDADFDLLIDGYSAFTTMVRNSPYVANTTWYSVENVLMQKTSCLPLLQKFSCAISDWYIDYLAKVAAKEVSQNNEFGLLLQRLNISKFAASGDFSQMETFKGPLKKEANDIKSLIASLGHGDTDLWKLMRGHNLWNTIVKPLEVKALMEKIKQMTATKMQSGNDYKQTRIEAMHELGITCNVKEHLEKDFYYNNMHLVVAPKETRDKLDKMFP